LQRIFIPQSPDLLQFDHNILLKAKTNARLLMSWKMNICWSSFNQSRKFQLKKNLVFQMVSLERWGNWRWQNQSLHRRPRMIEIVGSHCDTWRQGEFSREYGLHNSPLA
jgi:hypothetical protein